MMCIFTHQIHLNFFLSILINLFSSESCEYEEYHHVVCSTHTHPCVISNNRFLEWHLWYYNYIALYVCSTPCSNTLLEQTSNESYNSLTRVELQRTTQKYHSSNEYTKKNAVCMQKGSKNLSTHMNLTQVEHTSDISE